MFVEQPLALPRSAKHSNGTLILGFQNSYKRDVLCRTKGMEVSSQGIQTWHGRHVGQNQSVKCQVSSVNWYVLNKNLNWDRKTNFSAHFGFFSITPGMENIKALAKQVRPWYGTPPSLFFIPHPHPHPAELEVPFLAYDKETCHPFQNHSTIADQIRTLKKFVLQK